ALHLQGGLADSPVRAGLIFAPAGLGFAVVSLNWQRLPGNRPAAVSFAGFVAYGAGLLLLAGVIRGGGHGGGRLAPAPAPGAGAGGGGGGGGVRPADDRRGEAGAGGRRGRRDRRDRDGQPAGPGGGGGHVRHALPEPGRPPAAGRGGRIPPGLGARGGGDLRR